MNNWQNIINMKYFLIIIISIFITTQALADCCNSDTQLTLLFEQPAGSINLKMQQKEIYLLTLHNVKPMVIWFASKPKHDAGIISLKEFLNLWQSPQLQESFKKRLPTATLLSQSTKKILPIFALSDPHYYAKSQTLTYIAIPFKSKELSPLKSNYTLKDSILLIDIYGTL